MSKGEKRAALRVILVLLGVFVGWVAASYAFMYFIGNGATSDYATGYSITVFLAVFGAFTLAAFKVNLREHALTRRFFSASAWLGE